MKFGVVNQSTILNRFVLHTLQHKITHLAVITRKTNIKLGILKGGAGKEPSIYYDCQICLNLFFLFRFFLSHAEKKRHQFVKIFWALFPFPPHHLQFFIFEVTVQFVRLP